MKHVSEHVEMLERQCKERSLCFDDASTAEEGQAASIEARLSVDEHTYLNVREKVEIDGSRFRTVACSYYMVSGGKEVWGYDRDPSHEPEEHKHLGPAHERVPSEPFTLTSVISELWETSRGPQKPKQESVRQARAS